MDIQQNCISEMDSGIKYIEFEKKTYIRPTFSKPNPLTKYMKSSMFESISPTYKYLIWVYPWIKFKWPK